MKYWAIGALRSFSRFPFFHHPGQGLSRRLAYLLLLALLCSFPGVAQATDATNPPPSSLSADKQTLKHLTQTLLGHGSGPQLGVVTSSQVTGEGQEATDLLGVAVARQEILASLMETHPEEVLRVAIPKVRRSTLPLAVQAFVEEEVKVEGEVEVIAQCDGVTQALSYFLNIEDQRVSLHFVGPQPKNLQTGGRLRIAGVRIHNAIALRGKTKTFAPLSTPPLSPLGEQRVGVLLVNFRNNPATPYTVEYARNMIFNTTNAFIRENSREQTWLTGDVLGWYTIDFDSVACNALQIRDQAHAAATAAGIDLTAYSRYIYVFPSMPCIGAPGSGTVGGNPFSHLGQRESHVAYAGPRIGP